MPLAWLVTSLILSAVVMTILDSPGLSAIDQQWLDLLWDEEMLTLPDLTHTP